MGESDLSKGKKETGSIENELTKYEQFLITEYNNIAQAHFTSIGTISAFFKHYLLIISLPLSVIAVILKATGNGITAMSYSSVIICACTLYLVGICVMVYISNLRFEAVLYARVVNGIRSHFASLHTDSQSILVLTKSTSFPPFYELGYFLPVVYTFALVNTALPSICLWGLWLNKIEAATGVLYTILLFVLSIAVHHIVYYAFAKHWERSYSVRT